jgi:hypothetical protein
VQGIVTDSSSSRRSRVQPFLGLEHRRLSRASAIEGDGADLSSGSALDVRNGKDYILRLTRSERLGPEVRLVGARIVTYRKGNRKEPALAGYQHFGGGSDEPLEPYRSYPVDLTSGPQR